VGSRLVGDERVQRCPEQNDGDIGDASSGGPRACCGRELRGSPPGQYRLEIAVAAFRDGLPSIAHICASGAALVVLAGSASPKSGWTLRLAIDS
jgi:hypothetical protein